MTARVLNLAFISSAVLAVGVLLLGLTMRFAAPRGFRLSLTPSLHIAVSNARTTAGLGRIEIFNDAGYGPYRGSIIGIVGSDAKIYPPLDCTVAWGDAWGVYYRYFRWQDGRILWTLCVNLWYPAVGGCGASSWASFVALAPNGQGMIAANTPFSGCESATGNLLRKS